MFEVSPIVLCPILFILFWEIVHVYATNVMVVKKKEF